MWVCQLRAIKTKAAEDSSEVSSVVGRTEEPYPDI